jgi:hypothetical protein
MKTPLSISPREVGLKEVKEWLERLQILIRIKS